jgi:hypothetical protein
MSEWETFCDISYYHLWRVRRKNERGFNDGYHLQHGEEAKALVELLNRLERERVDHMSNCVVACEACNSAKADQEDWSPPQVDEPKSEIPQDDAAHLSSLQKTWEWRDGMSNLPTAATPASTRDYGHFPYWFQKR